MQKQKAAELLGAGGSSLHQPQFLNLQKFSSGSPGWQRAPRRARRSPYPWIWGRVETQEETPDEKALTLSLTSRRSWNPAQPSALGILAGAQVVAEAASPRLEQPRWGWQRGGERRAATEAEAELEGRGRRLRPHSLRRAVRASASRAEGT